MKTESSPVISASVQRRPTSAEMADFSTRRRAAEAEAHAQAGRAARHLMDICDAIRPPAHVTMRNEKTMAEAVAEIRTRGPQPPLDYAPEPVPVLEDDLSPSPWLYGIALMLTFVSGIIVGRVV